MYLTHGEEKAKQNKIELELSDMFCCSALFCRGKAGTVGAVAVDLEGNLACATSTGGMLNKMEGRVGDTPIIGQFTHAW